MKVLEAIAYIPQTKTDFAFAADYLGITTHSCSCGSDLCLIDAVASVLFDQNEESRRALGFRIGTVGFLPHLGGVSTSVLFLLGGLPGVCSG